MIGICPNCKRTYGEGIKYCLECGTPLQELKAPEPEKGAGSVLIQAMDQEPFEQLGEDTQPSHNKAPHLDVTTALPSQEAAETIRPILEELIRSIKSIEASLKVATDTNILILKKIYELESKLDASKSR